MPQSVVPGARTFHDFRRMLDELARSDRRRRRQHARPHARGHAHGRDASWASTCTARSRSRTRSTRRACSPERPPRHKLATQMGNTGHSSESTPPGRRADPRRGHRPGPRGPCLDQPADLAARPLTGPTDPPPVPEATLHWDLWLGPAPSAALQPTPITRSSGAAGGTSAPAPWATWAATSSTPPSGRSTSATRASVEAESRRPQPETAPPGRSSATSSRPGTPGPR